MAWVHVRPVAGRRKGSSVSQASPPPPSRSRHRAPPLTDPLAALRLVLTVASTPPRDETVCLLLDDRCRPAACVVVVGRADVVAVADTMLLLAEPPPPAGHRSPGGDVAITALTGTVRGLVLASVRPGRSHRPTADDELDWRVLQARFYGSAVDLLDWFLVDDDRAASLAELTGSPSAWPR